MSDDAFLQGLAADWRDVASGDRLSVAEAHRRGSRRNTRRFILAGAALAVLCACFLVFARAAQRDHSILMLIAALAYAASTALMAVLLWAQARDLKISFEQTPAGVLEQTRANAHSLKRELASVRWAAGVLGLASGAVGVSFFLRVVTGTSAILLSGAWAVTAAGLWVWQSHRSGILAAQAQTCDHLLAELRQAEE